MDPALGTAPAGGPTASAAAATSDSAIFASAEIALLFRLQGTTKTDARARVERAVEVARQESGEAGTGGRPDGAELRTSKLIARALSFGYGATNRRRRGA